MTNLHVFQESAKELRKLALLKTHPVAVRLLEKVEDIPNGTKRPVRDPSASCPNIPYLMIMLRLAE
jgi:uncharacterized protein (DUF169 family)